MPEIEREKLDAKLNTIPESDREGYIQALKAKGYTWKSNASIVPQDASGFTDSQDPSSPRNVPGLFPADQEAAAWAQAKKDHPNDYYAAQAQVLAARNKYTQSRPPDTLAQNVQGASGIVAGTAMAPLGIAKKGIADVGQSIQSKYPGIAGTALGGALKYGSNIIPESPKQLAANEATGAAVGAAMPAVRAVGGKVGQALEGLSGLEYKTPGILSQASNDPSLLFGPGKKAAGLAYEAIKDDLQVRPAMLTATSSKDLIDMGMYALEHGDLSPQEALIARRALDDKFSAIPASTANYLRPKFDSVAKTITADADAAFKKAIKSEALRQILATNKGGGTSIAKLVLGGFTGGALNVASSPIIQGAAATAAGAATRGVESMPNYIRGASINALLNKRKKDQKNGE